MISTKGRYALRVMIDLAEHSGEGYIPLKDIAARQEISKKYLEIIVKELVKGKMVSGQGDAVGAMCSVVSREEDVVVRSWNVGRSLATVSCLAEDAPPCERSEHCKTLPLWKEYDQLIHDFSITND